MEKKQQDLFEREPPPWELDDAGAVLVAQVYFNDPPFGPWDYAIPDEFVEALRAGMRVEVPLGRGGRTMVGYCGRIFPASQPPGGGRLDVQRLKPIGRLVDPAPLMAPELVELARQIARIIFVRWPRFLRRSFRPACGAMPGRALSSSTRSRPNRSSAGDR